MSSPINGSDSGCDDKRLTVEGYAEMWLAGNTINAQGRGLNLNVDMVEARGSEIGYVSRRAGWPGPPQD
jgi:hypothetical protein